MDRRLRVLRAHLEPRPSETAPRTAPGAAPAPARARDAGAPGPPVLSAAAAVAAIPDGATLTVGGMGGIGGTPRRQRHALRPDRAHPHGPDTPRNPAPTKPSAPHPTPCKVSGFVGCGHPEVLVDALRARWDETRSPRSLGLVVVAAVGDGRGRGLGRLAVEVGKWRREGGGWQDGAGARRGRVAPEPRDHPSFPSTPNTPQGLLARLTYAWIGLCPEFAPLIASGAVAAHNLPLGAVSHILRDAAARRPGTLSTVGLGTFVDPRHGGGKRGPASVRARLPDAVSLITVGGREHLLFAAPTVDVALLRGTTADAEGNVSLEGEALLGDVLNQARRRGAASLGGLWAPGRRAAGVPRWACLARPRPPSPLPPSRATAPPPPLLSSPRARPWPPTTRGEGSLCRWSECSPPARPWRPTGETRARSSSRARWSTPS